MNKIRLTLLFIFLAGCSATSQIPTIASTNLPTHTPLPTETAIHPTSTFTPTLTPTITLTPPPTWTLLPTLADQNSFLDFISFTENGICNFPCFAGITPGKTTWDESIFALRPMEAVAKLEILPNQESSYGQVNIISWYLYGGEYVVEGKFLTGSNTSLIRMNIQSFSIPTENIPSYSLPLPKPFNLQSVLNIYGIPSMVFIYTFVHDQSSSPPFKILLIYPENQFYMEYHREAKLSGNSVVACDSDYSLELLVVDNKDKLLSSEAISNTPEAKDFDFNNWKPVEQALNMSPEKFHELYSASSPRCMISPKNIWLP